jgi:hypothetical protein
VACVDYASSLRLEGLAFSDGRGNSRAAEDEHAP